MVVSARRLLQYFQLPAKHSRDISRFICSFFFAVFQNSYVFIPLFPADPLTTFCGTLRFRGTLFEKHWFNRMTVLSSQVLIVEDRNKKQLELRLLCCERLRFLLKILQQHKRNGLYAWGNTSAGPVTFDLRDEKEEQSGG